MKYLLAVTTVFLSLNSFAQMSDYESPIATATLSSIYVSSQTPTRIDNWDRGVSGRMLPNRTKIMITIPTTSGLVNCGFDATVSTKATTSLFLGTEFQKSIAPVAVPLGTQIPYYCLAQSVTIGSTVTVMQISPYRPGARGIP